MLPTTHTYSSFAAKDIAAEKKFYGDTLGIKVEEMYDGGLLELRLGGDKRVLIYSKDDFVPATYTVLNFPVPDVDAAVDELTRSGVQMARFDGIRPGRERHRPGQWRPDDRLVPRPSRQHPCRPQRRGTARLIDRHHVDELPAPEVRR